MSSPTTVTRYGRNKSLSRSGGNKKISQTLEKEDLRPLRTTPNIPLAEEEVPEALGPPRLTHSSNDYNPPSPTRKTSGTTSCPPLPAMLTVKISNGNSKKLRFRADVNLKTVLDQKALLIRMGVYLEDYIVLDESTGVILNLDQPLKPEITTVTLVPKAVKMRRKGPTASGSGKSYSPQKEKEEESSSSSSSSSLGLTKRRGGFGLSPTDPNSKTNSPSNYRASILMDNKKGEKDESPLPRKPANRSKTSKKQEQIKKFETMSSEDDTESPGGVKKKRRQVMPSLRKSTIMAVSGKSDTKDKEEPPEEKPSKGKNLYKRSEARRIIIAERLRKIYEEYDITKSLPQSPSTSSLSLENSTNDFPAFFTSDLPQDSDGDSTLYSVPDNSKDADSTLYTVPDLTAVSTNDGTFYTVQSKSKSSPLTVKSPEPEKPSSQTLEDITTTKSLTEQEIKTSPPPSPQICAACHQPLSKTEVTTSDPIQSVNDENRSINERFQTVCEMLLQSVDKGLFAKNYQINKDFVAISKDFLFTAHNVGRLIISEVYLSDNEKTIKPVTIGGFIGGKKYLVKEILFKFAMANGPITDDDVAMKIAGHELRSLNHLVGCNIPGVFYPLQCIIDFLGFRVVAMLFLPIGKDTLKVGSSDGGETYYYNDANLAALLEKIGKQLGLAPHFLHGRTVSIAGDVEGHKGRDNRYYIIDLSRTFPPMPELKQTDKYSHLYKMFRPEFVKMYCNIKEPLCSDGFSGFISNSNERAKFDKDLIKARDYFMLEVIPNAAKKLDKACMAAKISGALTTENPFLNLCVVLHRNGVNLRFMRYIYFACSTTPAKALLTIEMAARTIKKIIFKKIRLLVFEKKSPMELPYVEQVCLYLNKVFKRSSEVWETINKSLCSYFDVFPKDAENEFDALDIIWNFDPNKGGNQTGEFSQWKLEEGQLHVNDGSGDQEEKLYSGPKLLFAKLQKYLGIIFHEHFLKLIYEQNVLQSLQDKNLMNSMAISSLSGTVKHLYVISHAEGYLWKSMKDNRIPDCNTVYLTQASSTYCNMTAAQKFDEALVAHPTSVATLRNAITCRYKYWLESQNNTIKATQLDFVCIQFKWAQELDVTDGVTATNYFEAMKDLRKFEKAEDVLLEFLQHSPLDEEKKREYNTFLKKYGISGEAKSFLQLRESLEERIKLLYNV